MARRGTTLLIIRKYRKTRYGNGLWEYKIHFIDPQDQKMKTRRVGGFKDRAEAEGAAYTMLELLKLNSNI